MTAGAGSRPRAATGQARPGRKSTGEAVLPGSASAQAAQVQPGQLQPGQPIQPGQTLQGQPVQSPMQLQPGQVVPLQQAQPMQPQMQLAQPMQQPGLPLQPAQATLPGQPLGSPGMQPATMLQAQPPAGSTDRTMSLTPEQARAMAELGTAASPPPPRPSSAPVPVPSAWSGPGVDRTELATPGQRREVDEGARTLAMQRFDRAALAEAAAGREMPRGPMGWGEDPLTRTQKATAADPVSLTSTQRSPVQSLTATQRSPSAAYPPIPMDAGAGSHSSDLVDLRRPEMRSPAPRPPTTPRSLWVPVLIVVIVGLAGTALWLWFSSGR